MIGALGPDERIWFLIVDGQVVLNRLFQLPGAAIAAASELLLGEGREPSFDLVQPGSVGGREVQVEVRSAGQAIINHRRLVGAVVVQHQVNVEPLGDRLGTDVQELQTS